MSLYVCLATEPFPFLSLLIPFPHLGTARTPGRKSWNQFLSSNIQVVDSAMPISSPIPSVPQAQYVRMSDITHTWYPLSESVLNPKAVLLEVKLASNKSAGQDLLLFVSEKAVLSRLWEDLWELLWLPDRKR